MSTAWATKHQTPDEWGAKNRIYGPETGVPGPRNPNLTPYTIPFMRGMSDPKWKRCILATSAQSGKTEAILDIIGERLDNRPAPILYAGPSLQFISDQFEPRLNDLFRQAPTLLSKVEGGIEGKRQKKTLKRVAGVRLRLAHTGSSTALKSDPAAIALVDEYDEMLANIRGQGDPLGLIEARGDSYADFCVGVTSTCSQGLATTERDQVSGLEFWSVGDETDISSPIWRLWQQGTRHHWCWPCPHCGAYFVLRFRQLRWPQNATPLQALRNSWVECPHCEGRIDEEHKPACNAAGLYIAPGETADEIGMVHGEPLAETTTLSLWVSGLASPMKTFGERAESYLRALASGEQDKIQTAMNAGFGELHVPGGGDLPEWRDVRKRAETYKACTVPEGVRFLVAGIDVQGNRLPYVVRGFGAQAESWLIDHGEIWGKTSETKVWDELAAMLQRDFDGLPVKLAFIDSGFRPGKKESLPTHRVYDFCRRFKRFVVPTKGSSMPMVRPLVMSAIEVEQTDGKQRKYGLQLARLDSDYWKALVHERLTFETSQPGAFHLNADVTDDYCQQLVAEARVKGPSGRWIWIARAKDNHFLDAEALAAAAAYRIGAENIKVAIQERPHPVPNAQRSAPQGVNVDDMVRRPPPVDPVAERERHARRKFGSFAQRLNR